MTTAPLCSRGIGFQPVIKLDRLEAYPTSFFVRLMSQKSLQVKALAALEQLLAGLRLLTQAVQPNEAAGGVVVELVAGFVGGQLFAVEAVFALAADDRGPAL